MFKRNVNFIFLPFNFKKEVHIISGSVKKGVLHMQQSILCPNTMK